MSTPMVALASSVEMTWRGPMDSFYLGQEGSEINPPKRSWADQFRGGARATCLPEWRIFIPYQN
ncbi:hypothetical protein Acr_24g0012250 [Actinidia rufa]|uniref:Uncharacterized protein n=1 Tax=Actinidia rufa TaxID=165716 RepID=A0A7J0GW06_9ERIC|nr:hypothetical protein Acr_24g0012250 [Actinidia rufa]